MSNSKNSSRNHYPASRPEPISHQKMLVPWFLQRPHTFVDGVLFSESPIVIANHSNKSIVSHGAHIPQLVPLGQRPVGAEV